MTDNPSESDFNDELLSAYLDDELSAEDRAAVEGQLASDPAARQLLEELRHVSQAMRRLPPKAIGHDLREAVLRRVQDAKSVAAAGPNSTTGAATPLPSVTVGRTMRGWIWAGMAVAAALIIAFLNRSQPKNTVLPDVAQGTRRSLEDVPALHATPEANNPTTNFDADHLADLQPDASKPASAETDRFAGAVAAPRASTDLSTAAGGIATPAMPEQSSSNASQPIIVRVIATHEAIQNGSFDRLLSTNGILEDDTLAAGTRKPGSNGPRQAPENGTNNSDYDVRHDRALAENLDQVRQKNKSDANMVLVEASPRTIETCLSALASDTQNYLEIEVESDSAVAAAQEPAAKKERMDLKRFNRGLATQKINELRQYDKERYYYKDGLEQRTSGALGGGVAGNRSEAVDVGDASTNYSLGLDRGRARRVQSAQQQAGSSGAMGRAKSAVEEQERSASGTVQHPSAPQADDGSLSFSTNDRIQVLFLLSAGQQQAAASTAPPAAAKPADPGASSSPATTSPAK